MKRFVQPKILGALCAVLLLGTWAAIAPAADGKKEVERIEAALDDFHAAASEADEERYFGHFAPHGVFLGTDGTERWTSEEFRGFVHPYFSAGKGWTYTPRDRHVALAADGRTAWFDEMLDNAAYGECRGTGVLQRHGEDWKIEQYNLSIPMPNDLAKDFVARIRDHAGAGADE
ncbi:MAG: nuclear transport factor 2 family protein [bacterium]|nr:nuclear transport factor 2 family protein [bacterium]